ncbi:hypothetical protein UT300005_20330 [Clostridium sp. CTA-5]
MSLEEIEKLDKISINDDKIDWNKHYEVVEKIGVRGYLQKYFEECKSIWKTMVPKSGQANTLQGEMLRMAVKLRNEAMNNGNINWDDNFEWFCLFLKENLADCGLFAEEKNMKIKMILDYINDNGNYARKYANGEISNDQVDIFKLAYTDDDIYNYLEDSIAEYYLVNKAPILYEIKDFIYR